MEYSFGRLIDHIHLRVADLEASYGFYRAVFTALGRASACQRGAGFFYADELYVDVATEQVSHVHLAFQAETREAVERMFHAGLAAGGRDNGAPGERAYHPGYFAAFLLDPDGNNIEAVYHGRTRRSAESVNVQRLEDALGSSAPGA
jgi:catechol 2,3-dioxygenase-like lactoylglutathione lyase family enzyme